MRKLLVAVLVTGVALIGQANVAHADDVSVTANITAGAIGVRSITATTPIVLNPSLGVATVQGALAATVTETAVTGTNPWSVTAAMSALTKAGATDIANSNLAISNRAVVPVLGGGTAAATSGSENMSATRTLFTNTGQLTTAIYTGTYATTADLALSVPNGQTAGVYSGTMTITLVQ